MAEVDIILQGLHKNDDHETAVNKLLTTPNLDNYLFSVAYARKNGIDRIKQNLVNVTDKSQFFIGIRNGITSVQSILSLLEIGISPFVVDTASNRKIFHPKIFAAYGERTATVVLGSANLTLGGLNQNIEVSSVITLNRDLPQDENYRKKLFETVTGLPESFPKHVFQVTNHGHAERLLQEGRLEDEASVRLPRYASSNESKTRDELQPIPTLTEHLPQRAIPTNLTNRSITTDSDTCVLVWESKPLAKSNLNITEGSTTKETGHMKLGKGLMKDIDFQHYFKEIVFSELSWSTSADSSHPHLEHAVISAEIVIKGLSYGVHKLTVTHNPRTDMEGYNQRNVTTVLKWGAASKLIAKPDLLGRTLRLYKKDSREFVIVID